MLMKDMGLDELEELFDAGFGRRMLSRNTSKSTTVEYEQTPSSFMPVQRGHFAL
jgi:hypothetical protein